MNYYSNGKLLITAEYLVLDGATALALPTKYGQNLSVTPQIPKNNKLTWKSYNHNNIIWFECTINYKLLKVLSTSDKAVANTLISILKEAQKLNPSFLKQNENYLINTTLNFPKNWGLGTSSTLINNIAQWAKVNAFTLQFKIFGGSAYDIACAQNNTPILYQLKDNSPLVKHVVFNPNFKENLFFVYLNQKQNSREAIKHYLKLNKSKTLYLDEISKITKALLQTTKLTEFQYLIKKHEGIIAKVLNIKPIQERLFNDYNGQIKSLGAWGGDFILAIGDENTIQYFKNKGYDTIIPYHKMILK